MIICWHVWQNGKWYHCNKVAQHITPTISTFHVSTLWKFTAPCVTLKWYWFLWSGIRCFTEGIVPNTHEYHVYWEINAYGNATLVCQACTYSWHFPVYVYTQAIHFNLSTRSLHCNAACNGRYVTNFTLTTCIADYFKDHISGAAYTFRQIFKLYIGKYVFLQLWSIKIWLKVQVSLQSNYWWSAHGQHEECFSHELTSPWPRTQLMMDIHNYTFTGLPTIFELVC